MAEQQWNPIDTAPRDGTEMRLDADNWPTPRVGHFEGDGEGSGEWVTDDRAYDETDMTGPTVWALLKD